MKQKNWFILNSLYRKNCAIFIFIILISLVACVESDVDSENISRRTSEAEQAVYNFAVISDSHIVDTNVAKDYHNANGKLRNLGEVLSGRNFDFVVHTGDHINDLYCPKIEHSPADLICLNHIHPDQIPYACCDTPDNCYGDHEFVDGNHSRCPPHLLLRTYPDIISGHFWMPEYYIVLGNHDDRIWQDSVVRVAGKQAWGRVFGLEKSKFYYNPPAIYSDANHKSYYLVTKAGFQLFMLDSTFEHDNDEMNFGTDQLNWLKNQLSNTNYHSAVLFWHTRIRPNEFDVEIHDILKIIATYKDKIKMVFVGHGHQFLETKWSVPNTESSTIMFYETTSTVCEFKPEYGIPSYYHVKLDNNLETVTVENRDSIFKYYPTIATTSCNAS
jgi:predicted phosphodiesterase